MAAKKNRGRLEFRTVSWRRFFGSFAVAICLASAATGEESEEELPPFNDNSLRTVGLFLGCLVVGPSTCIYVSQSPGDELRTYRPREEMGFQFGYFPSYVLDFAESKAFQRFETSAFVGNVLVAVAHRRGVQEPNRFSSTSYRVAYSFDWRHVRPAIGIGVRRNVNARNGDGIELWFPLFANRSKVDRYEFTVFAETLWTIGDGVLRPELQARLEFDVLQNVRLSAGAGYFPDYHNPEIEVSLGPVMEF